MTEKEYREMFSQLHSSVREEAIIMKTKPVRRFRFASVPALAALVLFLTVGVAFAGVYGHRLQELIMPDHDTDTISVQGYLDSPEYKAAAEWKDFEDGYDQDESILDSVGNDPTPWDKKYGAYSVYSQEMADKVDEIAAKYDLKLHTSECNIVNVEVLRSVFGNFTSFDNDYDQGYYYKDGTFLYDGEETVDGRLIAYQFRRTMKGVFDTVYINIGDINKYEQWEYETANGDTVLLALSNDHALIIADYDDCFISVNIPCGTDESFIEGPDCEDYGTLTKKALEVFADKFNFSVLSNSIGSSDDEAAETDEAAEEQQVEAGTPDSEFKFECNPIDDPDAVITKRFGNVSGKEHEGIDFAADEGTAIHAVADGNARVWEADAAYGNYVIIDHNNGWCSVYVHCETILVEDGASVKAGDEIATVGSTGTSSGSHLHFELRGNPFGPVDPEPYFNK